MRTLYTPRTVAGSILLVGVAMSGAFSASAATTLLESGPQLNSRSISSNVGFNSDFLVFTLPVTATDTLFQSFTVTANDFVGVSGGSTFVSSSLEGFLLELDRGGPGAADDQVIVLNASNPSVVSISTLGQTFEEFTFNPRSSSSDLFELTPGLEYAILVTGARVEAALQQNNTEFNTNLATVNAANTPSFFGAAGGLRLSPEDLDQSANLSSILTALPTNTPLATTITLVPEPSTAAVSLLALGLLAGRSLRKA